MGKKVTGSSPPPLARARHSKTSHWCCSRSKLSWRNEVQTNTKNIYIISGNQTSISENRIPLLVKLNVNVNVACIVVVASR